MIPDDKKHIGILIDRQVEAEIRAICLERDISLSKWIREAIKAKLDEERKHGKPNKQRSI